MNVFYPVIMKINEFKFNHTLSTFSLFALKGVFAKTKDDTFMKTFEVY